jgi:hypothetical protein
VAAVVGAIFDLLDHRALYHRRRSRCVDGGARSSRQRGWHASTRSRAAAIRFQFRHAISYRTVIEGAVVRFRALLHRKVGGTLERRYAGVIEEHLDELAFHRVERPAGTPERCRPVVHPGAPAPSTNPLRRRARRRRSRLAGALEPAARSRARCDLAIAGQWASFWVDRARGDAWHEHAVADARRLGDAVRLARAGCWILPAIDELDGLMEEQMEALASLPGNEAVLRRLLLGCAVACLNNAGAPFDRSDPLSVEELALASIGDREALWDDRRSPHAPSTRVS